MKISKKVKIGHNNYYIIVDLEYIKKEENFPVLCLKNYKDKYSNYKEEKRALEESIDYAHERNELIKKRIHQSYSMKRSYRKFGRK